jgi:membrane fusion protein, copper/silver efflux system
MKKKLKSKFGHWSPVISHWSISSGHWLLVVTLLYISSCSRQNNHEHETDVYTCPMHPTVVQNKPGTCPVCGMDLVLKSKHGDETHMQDLKSLTKSPNGIVISSIKTVTIISKELPVTLKAQGLVTYDTRNVYTISARFSGRVEKIYARYAYQRIRKGERLATIYSPEILTAEKELIYLLNSDKDNTALIQSANQKLILLGLSQNQIENAVNGKELSNTISIFSPYDGYLIPQDEKAPSVSSTSTPTSTSTMGSGMGGGSSSNTSNQIQEAPGNSLIREGNYVNVGQALFKIANTSAIRIELDLPLSQGAAIKSGDEVDIDVNNSVRKATIDFVQPFFSENESFVKVRVYMKNAEDFQVGKLVSAVIKLKSMDGFWLPKEAVIDLGLDKIVFVKKENAFKPTKIIAGYGDGKLLQVKGLASTDTVAYNAQYLVDSEGFIKTSK